MKLNTQFIIFNQNIVTTEDENNKLKQVYNDLKRNLNEYKKDSDFSDLIIDDFVQGSFQRKTCLKQQEGKLPDIDIVVVTKMSEQEFDPPLLAQNKFIPFVEKYYAGQYERQGRSIGVTLKNEQVDLDIVITSDPKEAELGFLKEDLFQEINANSLDWDYDKLEKSFDLLNSTKLAKNDTIHNVLNEDVLLSESTKNTSPLRIPDKEANEWQNTNPMAQVVWAIKKNKMCQSRYLPVVRAIKWMRSSFGGFPKYPKGYPLEHIIGDNCPNNFTSVAEGVLKTLENIKSNYKVNIQSGTVPTLIDRGVDANVLSRQTFSDFEEFYRRIEDAYEIAYKAFTIQDAHESSIEWRKLFGEEFPLAPKTETTWQEPTQASDPQGPRRFA